MSSELSQLEPTKDLRILHKPTKRQKMFIQLWLDPSSETYGNTYRSALASGYSKSTASVMTANSRNIPWIQDVKELYASQLTEDHVVLGLQDKALHSRQDRDQIRAYELLAKVKGMFIERSQSDVHVTFTNSVPRPIEAEIVDIVEGEIVS